MPTATGALKPSGYSIWMCHLKGARHKALKQYLNSNTGILEALTGFDEIDRQDFIGQEIEATKWDPYWTTIRHFFEKL